MRLHSMLLFVNAVLILFKRLSINNPFPILV